MIQLSLLLYLISAALAHAASPPSSGLSEEGEVAVTRCIRPFLDVWERFHDSEAKNSPIVFSMPFLTRSSLLLLCESYVGIRAECLEDIITMPHSQSIPSHVIENVEFFCGPTSQVALDALPCISGSLLKSRHCSSSLLGIMPSSAHEKKCSSLISLFECTREKMDAECGEGTLITLAAAINAFGCSIKGFDEKVSQLLRVSNSTGELTMANTKEYIQEELKKMRLGEEDLEEGSAYDDPIQGTPILFEDDLSLQTVKETRSINASLIPHTVGANLTGIPIHASQYSSPDWDLSSNISDLPSPALPTNSSHFTTIECSVVQEEFLRDCYSELADRTSDWAAPLPVHIFSFSTAEIRDLCEDYRRTTENCLGPHFDLNCTGSHTVNTMDNRIGTMCTASLSQSFSEDFECLRKVTTLQEIFEWEKRDMEGMKGCPVSSPPSADCSSSPEFLCYSRRALVECSPDAFDLFISTVFTLGCHSGKMMNDSVDLMAVLMGEDIFTSQRTTVHPSSTTLTSESDEKKSAHEQFEKTLGKKEEKIVKVIGTTLEEGEQIFVEPLTASPSLLPPLRKAVEKERKGPRVFASKSLSGEEDEEIRIELTTASVTTTASTTASTITSSEPTKMTTTPSEQRTTTEKMPSTVASTKSLPSSTTPVRPSTTMNPASSMMSTESVTSSTASTTIMSSSSQSTASVTVETTPPPSPSTMRLTTSALKTTTRAERVMVQKKMVNNFVNEPLHLSSECRPHLLARSEFCMRPLMKRWMGMREGRTAIANTTFSLFALSSFEILELCDDYANLFLCAGMTTIRKCVDDDRIRYFRDLFGYSCSPQNIARFLTHFECLSTQQSKGNCTRFIEGVYLPGREEDKCVGLLEYRQCLAEESVSVCGEAALRELNEVVRQFGCTRREEGRI